MADGTKIEWTDATWNVITGCSVTSPGCTNCYAMRLAGTRLRHHPTREGLTIDTKTGPVWNGQVRFNEQMLRQPLQWKRPRLIFVCAHADLFHENVPDEWIDRVFAVMALCPQHTFQVLTKRADRMQAYLADREQGYRQDHACDLLVARFGLKAVPADYEREIPMRNVWLGVSVEDQSRRSRILDLAQTRAAVRWISGEPLLEGLSLTDIPIGEPDEQGAQWLFNALTGERYFIGDDGFNYSGDGPEMRPLDWVVLGGESGPGARPMHPDWARSIRDQCAAAGVPFHFKQWGDWLAVYDRDIDDPDWRHCNKIACRNARGQWLNLAGGTGFHGERVVRVEPWGKRHAGRLLDGVPHDGWPEARSHAQ